MYTCATLEHWDMIGGGEGEEHDVYGRVIELTNSITNMLFFFQGGV